MINIFYLVISLSIIQCFARTSLKGQVVFKEKTEEVSNQSKIEKNPELNSLNEPFTLNNDSLNQSFVNEVSNQGYDRIKLYIQRVGSTVICNVTNNTGTIIEKLIIERKTSFYLSNYTTIKTLNSSEIENLNLTGKIIFNDKYPESNKLDTYYRIKIEDASGVSKTFPAVLLKRQSVSSVDQFGDHDKNELIFKTEEDTLKYYSEDFGLKINVIPQLTNVAISIENIDFNNDNTGKWFLERKIGGVLGNYKLIKPFSESDLQELIENGILNFLDKFPESKKVDVYYRLRFIDQIMDLDVMFEPISIKGLKAK